MDQALRGKMCARMREVQTQVAERDELIEVIAIALLTRKNVFVLGDTGQAKSAVINLFRDGLTGIFANAAAGSDRVEHRIVFQHKAHLFLMVFPMKAPEGVPAVRSQKSAI